VEVTNVRVRLLVAMGVLLVGLLVLATQCPNANALVAVFSASPTSGTSPLTVNFDASSSSAPDGSILTYDWIFGDGDTASGETISHTYRQPGVYTVQLAVTDDDGSMDSTSCEITVTAAVGTPPSAGFTATPSSGEVPLAVNFNASAFDPDGSITSYAWSFGDGGNGTGAIVTHTYTSAGTYYPLLCVTDDDGNQDYAAQTVRVLAPPGANNPPTANFTASPTSGEAPLAVSFNASGSSDSDGSITSYAWSFGDGGSGLGVTASHTYSSSGIYTAQLTVTDDDGATDTATTQIEAFAPSVPEDLYVDANSGSDASGDGTQGNLYKTITKAVETADAGGAAAYTIHVAAGIYNTALGEEFPLSLQDISLIGEGGTRNDVKIAGEIHCHDKARMEHVSCYSLIRLSQNAQDVILDDCAISGSGDYGIMVSGLNVTATIRHCLVEDRGHGFWISYDSTSVKIEDCEITTTNGIYLVYDCYALIKNCTFSGCSVGIRVREASKARIQNNGFLSCRRGVELSHTGIADLGGGSLGSEGGNYFSVIAYAFYDGRSAYAGSSYAKVNTWDNPQPSGTVEGPVDNPLNYYIENEGNSIIFSD